MTRLIDADKLMQMIPTEEYNARMAITYAPTVDAEPVRHGHWIDPEDPTCYKCSVCGKYATQEYGLNAPIFWHYCPNCGSRMVNEEE